MTPSPTEPFVADNNPDSAATPTPLDSKTTHPPNADSTGLGAPFGREPKEVPGYEILGELGRGGMGVVYQARHLGLKRIVALKMILAGRLAGQEDRSRFRAEAEAVAKLQHPNIVQIYDIGEHEGLPYFSLEFVDGGSLAAKFRGEPQPPRSAAELVETLARGMELAHRQGIIHRDLKPANILLANQVPKITDFGLAKRLDDDSRQTRTGAVMGTPSYMSPEQASGQVKQIGPATDVYALGAILYEALTGRPPFKGATVLDTLEQVRTQDPVPASRLIARLPRDLETICLTCLEKDSSRRYPTAAALADDLRRFLDDRPILARRASRLEQMVKFARRNKLLVTSATAVAAALVLGIIGTSLGMAEARRAEGVANTNFHRAATAESDLRRQVTQLHLAAAEKAIRRGDWRGALRSYDEALGNGAADEQEIRLKRLQALVGLHDQLRAREALAALASRTDLSPGVQASVLLLRGDLALSLWEGREQALGDVKAALERDKDLSPADAAYARALVAEWPEEAEKHYLKALELDPFHYHARSMLLPILLVEGRLHECGNQAQIAALLFPEDPWPKVFQALLATFLGDPAAAQRHLQSLGNQVDTDDLALLSETLRLVAEAVQRIQITGEPQVPPAFVPRLWALATRFQKSAPASLTTLGANFINLPAVGNIWGPQYIALGEGAVGAMSPKTVEQLNRIVAHHHEALGYFLHAHALVEATTGKKQDEIVALMRQAEQSFRRATEAPSLVPFIVPQARYWAAYSESLLAKSRDRPLDPEMKRLAIGNMQILLGDRRLDLGRCAILADLAQGRLQEYDLARALLAEGERKAPGDPGLLRVRAKTELAAGAYSAAILAADKVLAKDPKDADALKVRQEAAEKMRSADGARPPAAKPQ